MTFVIFFGLLPNPGKPELKIEDLLYRYALSFKFKLIAF